MYKVSKQWKFPLFELYTMLFNVKEQKCMHPVRRNLQSKAIVNPIRLYCIYFVCVIYCTQKRLPKRSKIGLHSIDVRSNLINLIFLYPNTSQKEGHMDSDLKLMVLEEMSKDRVRKDQIMTLCQREVWRIIRLACLYSLELKKIMITFVCFTRIEMVNQNAFSLSCIQLCLHFFVSYSYSQICIHLTNLLYRRLLD